VRRRRQITSYENTTSSPATDTALDQIAVRIGAITRSLVHEADTDGGNDLVAAHGTG
jgi:hypothetical protein